MLLLGVARDIVIAYSRVRFSVKSDFSSFPTQNDALRRLMWLYRRIDIHTKYLIKKNDTWVIRKQYSYTNLIIFLVENEEKSDLTGKWTWYLAITMSQATISSSNFRSKYLIFFWSDSLYCTVCVAQLSAGVMEARWWWWWFETLCAKTCHAIMQISENHFLFTKTKRGFPLSCCCLRNLQ